MTRWRLLIHLGSSLWFVSVLCVLAGAGILFGTIALDRASGDEALPRGLGGGPDPATAILSTVAAITEDGRVNYLDQDVLAYDDFLTPGAMYQRYPVKGAQWLVTGAGALDATVSGGKVSTIQNTYLVQSTGVTPWEVTGVFELSSTAAAVGVTIAWMKNYATFTQDLQLARDPGSREADPQRASRRSSAAASTTRRSA